MSERHYIPTERCPWVELYVANGKIVNEHREDVTSLVLAEMGAVEYPWCGFHRTHPMVSFDPGGNPYCWEGYWTGEVDNCYEVTAWFLVKEADDE